jgi:hypothetical protein
MADTPAGMKINFDEQNMTKWEVLMDGPDQSIYAVRQNLGSSWNTVARSVARPDGC